MQQKINELQAYIEILQAERKHLVESVEQLREQNRRMADQVREIKQVPAGERWRQYVKDGGMVYWNEVEPSEAMIIQSYNGDPSGNWISYKLDPRPYDTISVRDTTSSIPKVKLLNKAALYGST
jgi:hypothetical protein